MLQFNLTGSARQQGIRCIFGLCAGIFARIMAEIAFIPALGIPCGGVALAMGLVIWKIQKNIGWLPCFCLCLLGVTTFLYPLEGTLISTIIGRFTESMLVLFYTGYFIYAILHGLVFLGEAFSSSKG